MIELLDPPILIEEEAPALDIAMPRVYRRPPYPLFQTKARTVQRLAAEAAAAHQAGDGPGFGKPYGQLVAEFQPAIRWALSCWDYLLSTEGCRFLLRTPDEKRYCRGDYRVFTESDYNSLVYRIFKLSLVAQPDLAEASFERGVRKDFWPAIRTAYCALEDPPDRRQRRLTPYSYLRCIPYQFLNDYHHERVSATVRRLPFRQRQVIELYYLNFLREEAVLESARISLEGFHRWKSSALEKIASKDYLSYILLIQIERY